MKLIAANGPWSLRAHTGALDVQADQELTVTSVGDEIHAAAQGRIVLTAGSSRVVLDGGNITFTCPGTFTVKAAAHAFEGPGRAEPALPYLPHQRLNEPTHWIELSHRDPDGQPMAGQRYKIHFEGCTVVSGALDANGQAHHDNVPARALRVEYEPRTPEPDKPWQPLQSLLGQWNQNGTFVKYTYNKARDGEITVWEGPTAMQWLGRKDRHEEGFLEGGLTQIVFNPKAQIRNAQPDGFVTAQFPDMVEGNLIRDAAGQAKPSGIRTQINDPRMEGPFETGWGFKDFEDQHDLIGLPNPNKS